MTTVPKQLQVSVRDFGDVAVQDVVIRDKSLGATDLLQ